MRLIIFLTIHLIIMAKSTISYIKTFLKLIDITEKLDRRYQSTTCPSLFQDHPLISFREGPPSDVDGYVGSAWKVLASILNFK